MRVHWFGGYRDGRLVKPTAAELPGVPAETIARVENGMAFLGSEGVLVVPEMRVASRPRLFPEPRERAFLAALPPRTLPRPKGGHHDDWVQAILQDRPAATPFAYGAALTEKVLLGTLAQRTGRPVRWRPAEMRCIDNPEADALVRPALRRGWEWIAS